MKRMEILIILVILTFRAYAPSDPVLYIPTPDKIQPYEALWTATCRVESNFDTMAIGDKHLKNYSYGIVQIRQSRLDDFYKQTGIHYTTHDMFSPIKSKQVFMHYASGCDMECVARRWNGGGRGMEKSSTIKYWQLIQTKL